MAKAGADLLVRTLEGLAAGTIQPIPQDDAAATLAPIIKKEDGAVDWSHPAQSIHNLIRGLQPWPGAFTSFRGQSLHLWRSRLTDERCDAEPGTLFTRAVREQGLFAVGGDGAALELLKYNWKAESECLRVCSPTATVLHKTNDWDHETF